MQVYGFNVNPLDQFGTNANPFTIYDENLGRSLDVREWSKVNHKGFKDFYAKQKELLEGYRDAIFAKDIASRTSMDVDISKAIKTYETVNGEAVQQILSSFGNWQDFLKIVRGDDDAPNKNVYGFDLETFGDIQKGNGVFGITEIAIGRRDYSTIAVNQKHKLGSMAEGASIAVGVKGNEQISYLEGLIKDFGNGKWTEMSEIDKVALKRLTRYAGNYHDVFADNRTIGVLPGQFTIVKGLSDEVLTVDAMRSGLNNLKQVGQTQDPTDVISTFSKWLVGKASDANSLFYGANSAYDYDSLSNMMSVIGFNASDISAVQGMKKTTLDTVYFMRTVAAMNDDSVKGFMKNVAGRFTGASVDEQIKAFAIGLEQLHFGFADVGNEGNLVDFYGRSTFADFFADKDKFEQSVLKERNIGDTMFRIKRGRLKQADGREFGYTPNFEGNKYGNISHNMSIVGESWMLDTERSGIIKSQVEGQPDIYAAVFKNVADTLLGSSDEASRFVITSDTSEGLLDRIIELTKGSDLFDVSKGLNPDEGLGQMVLADQAHRYADLGRRQFAKFFSAGDSRINNGEIVTGYNHLHKVLQFEAALQDHIRNNPDSSMAKVLHLDEQSIFSPVDKSAIEELTNFHNEYIKTHKDDAVIFSRTQAQTYLGMRPRIADEFDLLKTIDEAVEKAYQGQKGVGIDMGKTALASRMYAAASNILFDGLDKQQWENDIIPLLDNTGVDIAYTTRDGAEAFFRVNAYSRQTASTDVSRFLRNTPLDVAGYNQVIENLKKRGILSPDFKTATDSLELEPYSAGQTLGIGIFKGIQTNQPSQDNRIRQNIAASTRFEQLRAIVDPETGSPVALGQLYAMSEDYRKTIGEEIQKVANSMNSFTYSELKPGQKSSIVTDMIGGGDSSMLKALGLQSGDTVKDGEVAGLLEQMFDNPNKRYSISERTSDGLQAFYVAPPTGSALHEGQSGFVLLTNQKHVGHVIDFLNSDKMQDSFESFQKLRNSELSQHAVIAELPRIHKWMVGQGSGIQAVKQGEDFFKIMTPTLRTFVGDDGRLNVSYEDPAYQIASMFRKYGAKGIDYALDNQFEKGTNLFRRGFNGLNKEAPSFTTRRGVNGELHLNTNEAMRAYEVRLHEGLSSIFHQLVMTPHLDANGNLGRIDGQNLNAAQQIVDAFGHAKGLDVSQFKNSYENYFNKVLNDSDFEEVFHSRMVYGKIGRDGWLGSYLPQDGRFDKSILDVMRDVIGDSSYAPILQKGFNTDAGSFYNIIDTMAKLPVSSALDAIGSESAVGHGSYFLRKYGSFRPQSNLYSMMRPSYIQQGNAHTYELDAMLGTVEQFKYLQGSGSGAIYFGVNQLSEGERLFRESIQANNPGIIIDEGQFIGKVKTFGDYDAKLKFDSLLDTKNQDALNARIEEFNRILKAHDIDIEVTTEQYQAAVKAARKDLGFMYEDSIWAAPALKDTPLFRERDGIGFKFGTAIDEDATRQRLQSIVDSNGGNLTADTVIGKTRNGRDIYFGKSNAILTQDDIEKLVSGNKVKLKPVGFGDIIDDKIYVNGMEKGTTRTINFETLLHRMGLDTAENISKFNLDSKKINDTGRDLATYIFGQVTDGAVVAGNFQYAKHGGVVGLHNAWNLISLKYTEAGRQDEQIAKHFVGAMNSILQDMGEEARFDWDPVRKRLYGNDDIMKNPAAFYERLINEMEDGGVLSPNNSQLGKRIQTINESIKNTFDEFTEKNLSYSILQRQIMNEHMGVKFTIDKRLEQGLRFQGLHTPLTGPRDADVRTVIDEKLVDAFKEASLRYTGYSSDMVYGGFGKEEYGALRLIQRRVGLAKGADRASYNRSREDLGRSISGISESVQNFLNPMSQQEIADKNIVEVSLNDLLEEAHRGGGTINVEDLMDSIFFIDGKPSDFLKKLAEKKENLDLEHDSFSIFVNTKGYGITVDNKTALTQHYNRNQPGNRSEIEGFLIPIFSGSTSMDGEQVFFQPAQGHVANALNKIAGILEHQEKYKDAQGKVGSGVGVEIGNVLRTMYEKLDDETNYLRKKSSIYKYAQTWTIPHSHQFLSQDQVAPLIGILTEEELEEAIRTSSLTAEQAESLKANTEVFRESYARKQALEKEIRDISRKTGDIFDTEHDKLLEEYNTVVKQFKKASEQLTEYAFGDTGDKRIAQAVIKSTGVTDVLELAQREVINGKIHTGMAVAVSEQGLEGMGLSMGDVAQGIVADYERGGLEKKLLNKEHGFEMIDEFFGNAEDKRISLGDSPEKWAEVQVNRQSFMSSRYDQLREDLRNKLGLNFDLTQDQIDNGIQRVTVAEAADRKLRELIALKTGNEAEALQGISIKDLNELITNNETFMNGLPEDIRKFYEQYTQIFKETGIAQNYMQTIGVQGLLTRYPVFNLQPWVRVVLDPEMRTYQIRASNPVINKLIHLDNDGDTLMLGILAHGSSLYRHDKKANPVDLFNAVYKRNIGDGSYTEKVMLDAFKDNAPYKVNDVSNVAKQEAALLQIIDAEGYNAALKEYLTKRATYRSKDGSVRFSDPSAWVEQTLKTIDDDPGLLEAALNSKTMMKFYKERIGSTLNNENALISATVARIRKDYIGYVSTPNYRVRETLNYTYKMLKEQGGQDENLALLEEAMLDLTSFKHANGGLFSIIEQKIIDPKHARDGLSPIGITRYSSALKRLMKSNGDYKEASTAMQIIMNTIGPKALDTQNAEQARTIAQIIVDTKDLKEYDQLLETLSNLKKGSNPNGTIDPTINGIKYSLDKRYGSMLENARAFKALLEVTKKVPDIANIYETIAEKATVSALSQYYSKFDDAERQRFLKIIHGLGINEDVFAVTLDETARSASLPPFKKNHVYFQVGGGYDVGLGGATRRWVYQGDGEFHLLKNGKVDSNSVLHSRKALDFEDIGLDPKKAISLEAYTTDQSVRDVVNQQINTRRLEKHLNQITIGDNDKLNETLPSSLSQKAFRQLNQEKPKDFLTTTQVADKIVNRQDWDATYTQLKDTMRAYDAGLGIEIRDKNAPSSAVELLRSLNRKISEQTYRDLAAYGPEEAIKRVSDLFTTYDTEVRRMLGGDFNFQTALDRSKLLPEDFNMDKFRDSLDSLAREVYNVNDQMSSLETVFSGLAEDIQVLKGKKVSADSLKAVEDILANKDQNIATVINETLQSNRNAIQGAQKAIYRMLSPDGATRDQFETYAKQAFRWTDSFDAKESMVGFGTYMGRTFKDLSQKDIDAIRSEGQALIDTAQQAGKALSHELNFSISSTLSRLEGFTPTARKSAIQRIDSDAYKNLTGIINEQVQGLHRNVSLEETLKGVRDAVNTANENLKRRTISGDILDKVKSLNISGKHVGIAVGAMAAIGVTNKLLHRQKKSPFEASQGSGSAAPIINGHRQGEQAPAFANTGRRTVYHDSQSGLDFKVSAQTKRRLDANGYGGVVHRAGGGSASVHIYNDTRGVSDNWLSNKFSELAE